MQTKRMLMAKFTGVHLTNGGWILTLHVLFLHLLFLQAFQEYKIMVAVWLARGKLMDCLQCPILLILLMPMCYPGSRSTFYARVSADGDSLP